MTVSQTLFDCFLLPFWFLQYVDGIFDGAVEQERINLFEISTVQGFKEFANI